MFKKIFLLINLIVFNTSFLLFAQEQEGVQSTSVEMADAMRADGKIYVVVMVVMIVFTFLSVYLLLTDRQVKKLEKEVKNMKRTKS